MPHIRHHPVARLFKPQDIPAHRVKTGVLRNKGLENEEVARLMNISHPAFSRVLSNARKSIARILREGAALKIGGSDLKLTFDTENAGKRNNTSKHKGG